ncbi:unnamed protein product [Anisakis simplex]|uniref:Uncharacterized protein n=1 Tax=Anisakis simplex TaxID=6269 RepID=A0A3P6RTZ4_ANISI|nr:unnamed protein product [Anisakis simplex]
MIFNTADVTQSDTEFGYNNSTPGQSPQSVVLSTVPGECHCKSGATEYYYKGSHDTNWLDYLDGSQPLVMTLTCGSRGVNGSKDMCVCVSDNECYRPDRGGMTASFAPFCTKDDGCHMYMFIAGPPHSEFVRCRGGGSVIPVNVQFLPIGAPRPLPDSYLKIKSITCNGCNHRVSTTCTPA